MDRTRSYRTDVPTPRMLTTAVAAKEIGISSGTVRKLLKRGVLYGRRLYPGARHWLVYRESVDRYCQRQTRGTADVSYEAILAEVNQVLRKSGKPPLEARPNGQRHFRTGT